MQVLSSKTIILDLNFKALSLQYQIWGRKSYQTLNIVKSSLLFYFFTYHLTSYFLTSQGVYCHVSIWMGKYTNLPFVSHPSSYNLSEENRLSQFSKVRHISFLVEDIYLFALYDIYLFALYE